VAKNSLSSGGTIAGTNPSLEASFNRIANLLALLLVKGESEPQKVLSLIAVGYTPAEIGQLLGKRANTISAIIYRAKREADRKPEH